MYDTTLFYALNILVIPALVIFHLALITSPKAMPWNHLFFLFYAVLRLGSGFRYSAIFTKHTARLSKGSSNEKHNHVWKKVLIGIVISIPFLFVILNLLISADAQFERLLSGIPDLLSFRPDYIFRVVIILIYTFGFFGFMQVLLQKNIPIVQKERYP